MIGFRTVLTTAAIAVSVWLPMSVQAEVLLNSWTPFDQIVSGVPECGGGEDLFRAEGMVHAKVATLRNGNLAIHNNIMGTVTPLGSEEDGVMFRQNISNVYPMMGEREVYTYNEHTRVITKNGAPVRIHIRFHVTEIEGEIKSYIDVREVTCD